MQLSFSSLPPLSLYIHIPWCVRKCPYCDFNSHEGTPDEDLYFSALTADLVSSLPEIWGRKISSVFFGGGTPSLASAAFVEKILGQVRALVRLDSDAEVTLEANPGTLETGKFSAFRDAGVNRLSIGVQSFDDKHLASLGRIHDARQAHFAVEEAKKRFENVNLDIMYALPNQTLREAEKDISTVLSYSPRHVSAYHLTIEPNTYFHKHTPIVPGEDEAFEMQVMIEEALSSYDHYETSAFSIGGARCRHNLNYWEFGDYLGIGAGAHSKISLPDRIVRKMRYKHPKEYIGCALSGSAIQEEHAVPLGDIPFEFMMNALRLNEGVPFHLFEERTGLSRVAILKKLDEAQSMGFVSRDPVKFMPTLKGRRFLNELLQLFLP